MTDDYETLLTSLESVLHRRAPLYAKYGPGGTFDHSRKTLLAAIKNEYRSGATTRVSEASLDDVGHADERYVKFVDDATEERAKYALLDADAQVLEYRLQLLKARTYENAQLARMQ